MSNQTTLPEMRAIFGTYHCGHGTTHRIPSEAVAIYKLGGAGFVGECEAEPLGESSPVALGDHVVILGGKSLDSDLWLALDERAAWFPGSNPDREPVGSGATARERRAECRAKMRRRVE